MTTTARRHRISTPKIPRQTRRETREQAMAIREAEVEDNRQQIETSAKAIRDLLPSASPSSPPTGGQARPECSTPSSADARTLPPTLPPASTTTEREATCSSTTQPPGEPGATALATVSAGRAVVLPWIPTAGEVRRAIKDRPLETALITECLPQPLKAALRGQRRETAGPIGDDQVEIPSLSSRFWVVRLRRRAYLHLRAVVDAQAEMAELGSEEGRKAMIAHGRAASIERQTDPDAGETVVAKAQADVWWAALGQYPAWAIYAAFMAANAANKFAPRPAEVAAEADRLYQPVRWVFSNAKPAVADCERLRPEWIA